MTDNSKFKEEATELLKRLIDFQRKYHRNNKRAVVTSPAALFEGELRQMLMIARTDEENEQQRKTDSYL